MHGRPNRTPRAKAKPTRRPDGSSTMSTRFCAVLFLADCECLRRTRSNSSDLRPILANHASMNASHMGLLWTPDLPPIPDSRPGIGGNCSMGELKYNKVPLKNSTMCLAPEGDWISDKIRKVGHWYDCMLLRRLWHAPVADRSRGGIFLEVGANIGTCTLEFLLLTDAYIIAVEPSPFNLYHLTRTLHMAALQNPALASRVAVLTLAAGDASIRGAGLRTPHGNAGNSQMVTPPSPPLPRPAAKGAAATNGRAASAHRGLSPGGNPASPGRPQKVAACRGSCTVQSVAVEPLDKIFPGRALRSVRLFKVDTEGFECNVLRGARQLLRSGEVKRVTAEVNSGMLQRAGCDETRLHRELWSSGAYNVSLRPTMTESTFIAQRFGGPLAMCSGPSGCPNVPLDYSSPEWQTPGTLLHPHPGSSSSSTSSSAGPEEALHVRLPCASHLLKGFGKMKYDACMASALGSCPPAVCASLSTGAGVLPPLLLLAPER
jgi:hypothetical protein